jgi:hypothetical protein
MPTTTEVTGSRRQNRIRRVLRRGSGPGRLQSVKEVLAHPPAIPKIFHNPF